jgi:oligoribonuclease
VTLERSADNLVWIDLEFTNLDPATSFIMQAAMIVTTPDLVVIPPPSARRGELGLLSDVQLNASQANTASEWVRQNQSEHLKRSQGPNALPVGEVEQQFVDYLMATCEVPQDIRSRPILCGNSVHGDHGFISHHMPDLCNRLSFRLIDVTGIKELAKRWCPALEYRKTDATIREWFPGAAELAGEAHDALYDIKASIAELNFYRQKVFVPALRGAFEESGSA